MGDQKYSLALRRWRRPARGFRLSPARLSVRRLRAKLWTLLGLLGRYVRSVRTLTRGLVAAGSCSPPPPPAVRARRFPVGGVAGKGAQDAGNGGIKAPRRPPCMRSNSFYARAVAECLEFIKGSNAVPPASPLVPHATPRRASSRCLNAM